MSTNDSRSPAALHDDMVIENLLAETGINDPTDAGLLKPDLMLIRGLVHGPQPAPSSELAALLTGLNTDSTAAPGPGSVSSLEAHRTKRHSRLAIAAAALTLSLGAGAAAAVASPDFRETIQNTVGTLVQALALSGSADRPGTPAPSLAPAAGVPDPAASSPVTAGPVKPELSGPAVPTPTLPAPAEAGKSTPRTDPEPGINTPPDGPHPARPDPDMPPPAAPAEPAEPGPATAAPRQPGTVSVAPVPAPEPASGNTTPPRPGGR